MPARSTEALVDPKILIWARETAGLSHEEAARILQTRYGKVRAWESGDERPSMPQLRKMASAYKRLLSDFYLSTPPSEIPLPHDFRRLPGEGVFRYSRSLRYQLRLARLRRDLALDLMEEQDIETPLLPKFRLVENTEKLGDKIRDLLRVPLREQYTWRDPRKSYNAWRSRIEGAGVLVFQVTGVPPAEVLGFSLTEQPLPVIGVNRKLAPNGRTFTLLHEFVHVLLHQSSLCDLDEDYFRPPQESRTEVFCNATAGAALVPREALLSDPLVSQYGRAPEWSDDELATLARKFGVSQHVILRRLLAFQRTTQTLYASRLALWRAQVTVEKDFDEDFRRNMPREVLSDLGRPFVRMVLESYLSSNMSLSDASRYLGLRAGQVAKVGELVWGT